MPSKEISDLLDECVKKSLKSDEDKSLPISELWDVPGINPHFDPFAEVGFELMLYALKAQYLKD